MSCSKCNDHGIHLGEGKKLRWRFCSCDIGQLMDNSVSFKPAEEQGKNKFSAEPTRRGALKFASKGEALRYDELCRLEYVDIKHLQVHPRYELKNEHVEIRYANGRLAVYTADFQYEEFDENGDEVLVTEDFKSKATMTEASSLRIAVFESLYGRKVRISKK